MRNRVVLTDNTATSIGTETVGGVPVLKVSVVKTVGGGGSGGTVDQGAAGVDPWLVNTELADAAALSDAFANPTTSQVGSFLFGWDSAGSHWDRIRSTGNDSDAVGTAANGQLKTISQLMGYNGTTWDRLRSTTANGLVVDVSRVQGTVTISGTATVSGTVAATQSGTWNIGTLSTITNVVHVDDNSGSLTVDNNGTFAVQAAQSGTWAFVGTKTNNNAAPGATNIGSLPALANASTPSWTEGNQVALSVDLSGNLRTSASITPATDSAPATQNITAQDTNSSTSTGANNQSFVTGSPTANSAASFSISSAETIKVQVTGTWTGTLAVEHSYDSGTTWVTSGVHQDGTAYTSGNFTANFIGGKNVSGATNFRVRATAAWTGTATVKIIASSNPNSIYVANGISLQDSTTQTQKLGITANNEAKITSTKTNNNATPGATNLGVLGAVASAFAPAYTEGNQVGVSVDLSGNLRTNNYNQNAMIIDLLTELLSETKGLRFAMATWTSEAVAGFNIKDFDPQ